jgi:hypothetical protein
MPINQVVQVRALAESREKLVAQQLVLPQPQRPVGTGRGRPVDEADGTGRGRPVDEAEVWCGDVRVDVEARGMASGLFEACSNLGRSPWALIS